MSTYTDGREAGAAAGSEPGAGRPAADGRPDGQGPAPRGRAADRTRWALGGLAVVVLAALVSVVVQKIVTRLPLPASSNVPEALEDWVTVLALVVLAVAFVTSRLPGWARHGLVAAVLSALGTATVALPLQGTKYYLGGISVDQSFRTQYLTRLTDSASPHDMNYAGIAPFYPSGWFWPAGRFAAADHLPGWEAYKPVALLTLALVPVVAYWLWQRLAGPRVALAVGLVVIAAGLAEGATEPYSWAVAALLPAIGVLFWRTLTGPRADVGRMIAVGVLMGGAVSLYTLYAGYGALSLVVMVAWTVWRAASGERRAALKRGVLSLVVAGVAAVVVALPVWTPYALYVLRHGGGTNVAARFLPMASAQLPAPMLDATPWGVFLLLGTGYALWRLVSPAGRDRDSVVPLGVMAACCYLWYALSTLALALGTTLLAFRIETVLNVVLGTVAVFALRAALHRADRRWPAWTPRWAPIGSRRSADPAAPASSGATATRTAAVGRRAVVVAAVAAVFVATIALQENGRAIDPEVNTAYTDPYPSGPNAKGETLDDRDERWVDQLTDTISRRTGGRPADDQVVLTTNYALLSYEPYFGFQQATPHYANPLADYSERSAYIDRLAGTKDPAAFQQLLDRSPWRAPSVFVLRTEDDGEHFQHRDDLFPADPNVAFRDVVFDPAVFADGWSSDRVGPFTVYVKAGS